MIILLPLPLKIEIRVKKWKMLLQLLFLTRHTLLSLFLTKSYSILEH